MVFPQLQASIAFVVTPSDTVNIDEDVNMPAEANDAKFVFLHNPAAGGTVRVLPAGQGATPVTVYIPQGATLPLAVKRVYNTNPSPPTGLIAFVGKQR